MVVINSLCKFTVKKSKWDREKYKYTVGGVNVTAKVCAEREAVVKR